MKLQSTAQRCKQLAQGLKDLEDLPPAAFGLPIPRSLVLGHSMEVTEVGITLKELSD